MTDAELDDLSINTIRTLSMDAYRPPNPATPAHRWH
jgi:hypothetical protein